jgi:hypothetical protein
MSKNKVTPAASVIAFGYSLDAAKSAARSAATKWAHVYEAAADMMKEVPSRSLAANLAAAGIECNKDTVGFYADAAPWAYLMTPSGEVSMFEAAAVMADQASTLLPHECVSYGRNRGGLTIEEVRQVIADYNEKSLEIAGDDSISDDEKVAKIVGELSKAIRKLRTKAKAKRTPQPPEIDDKTDDQTDGETDDQGDDESAPAGDRAANLISAIVGPMNALTAAIRSGEVQLDEHQKHTLNAHWSELIKASRDVAAA